MEKIFVTCPKCKSEFSVPPSVAGQTLQCACGEEVHVPNPDELEEPTSSAETTGEEQNKEAKSGKGKWYFMYSGLRFGPLTLDELVERAQQGEIDSSQQVYDPRRKNWSPAKNIPELAPPVVLREWQGAQWHMTVKGETYGPYSTKRLLELIDQGRASAKSKVWCKQLGEWATLGETMPFVKSPTPEEIEEPVVEEGKAEKEAVAEEKAPGEEWYIDQDGLTVGPVTLEYLESLAEGGGLAPDQEVKDPETGEWVPASSVESLEQILAETAARSAEEVEAPEQEPEAAEEIATETPPAETETIPAEEVSDEEAEAAEQEPEAAEEIAAETPPAETETIPAEEVSDEEAEAPEKEAEAVEEVAAAPAEEEVAEAAAAEWYVAVDGEEYGPYDVPEMEEMLQEGRINAETPVWKESFEEWSTVGEVDAFETYLEEAAEEVAEAPSVEETGAVPDEHEPPEEVAAERPSTETETIPAEEPIEKQAAITDETTGEAQTLPAEEAVGELEDEEEPYEPVPEAETPLAGERMGKEVEAEEELTAEPEVSETEGAVEEEVEKEPELAKETPSEVLEEMSPSSTELSPAINFQDIAPQLDIGSPRAELSKHVDHAVLESGTPAGDLGKISPAAEMFLPKEPSFNLDQPEIAPFGEPPAEQIRESGGAASRLPEASSESLGELSPSREHGTERLLFDTAELETEIPEIVGDKTSPAPSGISHMEADGNVLPEETSPRLGEAQLGSVTGQAEAPSIEQPEGQASPVAFSQKLMAGSADFAIRPIASSGHSLAAETPSVDVTGEQPVEYSMEAGQPTPSEVDLQKTVQRQGRFELQDMPQTKIHLEGEKAGSLVPSPKREIKFRPTTSSGPSKESLESSDVPHIEGPDSEASQIEAAPAKYMGQLRPERPDGIEKTSQYVPESAEEQPDEAELGGALSPDRETRFISSSQLTAGWGSGTVPFKPLPPHGTETLPSFEFEAVNGSARLHAVTMDTLRYVTQPGAIGILTVPHQTTRALGDTIRPRQLTGLNGAAADLAPHADEIFGRKLLEAGEEPPETDEDLTASIEAANAQIEAAERETEAAEKEEEAVAAAATEEPEAEEFNEQETVFVEAVEQDIAEEPFEEEPEALENFAGEQAPIEEAPPIEEPVEPMEEITEETFEPQPPTTTEETAAEEAPTAEESEMAEEATVGETEAALAEEAAAEIEMAAEEASETVTEEKTEAEIQWFCLIGEKELGPVPLDQLVEVAEEGKLPGNAKVRNENMDEWTPASEIPELGMALLMGTSQAEEEEKEEVPPPAAVVPEGKARVIEVKAGHNVWHWVHHEGEPRENLKFGVKKGRLMRRKDRATIGVNLAAVDAIDWVEGASPKVLRNIRTLSMDTADELFHLEKLPAVEALDVSEISDEDLEWIADQNRPLKSLYISWSETIKDLTPLSGMETLQCLIIADCPEVEDLSPIAELTNLKRLEITHCEGVENIEAISGLNKITRLSVSNCNSVKDISPIQQPNLVKLDLSRSSAIHDINPLGKLQTLLHLDLSHCSSVRDISPLRSLQNLKALQLSNCSKIVTVQPICALSELQRVSVPTNISDKDLAVICKSLPHLEQLLLRECTDLEDIRGIVLLQKVRQLSLEGCRGISDIRPLGKLDTLARLNLSRCPKISELQPIMGLKHLRLLRVRECMALPREEILAFKKAHPKCKVISQ
ncbi:MAG: GYF domain-containing protein [Candidatus Brocadiia bacterium]